MIYTTYFSKLRYLPKTIVPVSISLWPPRDYSGRCFRTLAPSKDILTEYKAKPNWARYTERFNREVLARLDPDAVIRDLRAIAGSGDIALVCFERDSTRCHRSLVAKWLEKHGYEVKEYGA